MPTDREQSEKFKETARELGVDLDEEKLKSILGRMGGRAVKAHSSDCSLHDAPAFSAGACDCEAS